MNPAALRLVDADGAFVEVSPELGEALERIERLERDLQNAERDLRAKRALITKLQRDKERERVAHELRDVIIDLHDYWRERCGHPRSQLTADRFDACAALLPKYIKELGREEAIGMARRAIEGAGYEPFCRPRRNGSTERFDDFELIFRGGARFERFANRAPR